MADEKPTADVDVTKEWRATQGQESAAKRLRLFAALAWLIAIGTEVAGIVLLRQHKFDHGNMPLLIGLLVVIAVFAIAGSLMWKAANKHDPASKAEPVKFFVQNQLGAIITVIAFLPLIVLIFMDKDMDPKNKKIAGGIGVVLAGIATVIGIDFSPPSVEQYTQDMNQCAAEIKSGQPTKDCSPEVAEQAQAIARDSATVAEATKSPANPNGLDVQMVGGITAASFDVTDTRAAPIPIGLKDGIVVRYAKDETPARGKDLGVLEQIFGNISQRKMFKGQTQGGVPGSIPGGGP